VTHLGLEVGVVGREARGLAAAGDLCDRVGAVAVREVQVARDVGGEPALLQLAGARGEQALGARQPQVLGRRRGGVEAGDRDGRVDRVRRHAPVGRPLAAGDRHQAGAGDVDHVVAREARGVRRLRIGDERPQARPRGQDVVALDRQREVLPHVAQDVRDLVLGGARVPLDGGRLVGGADEGRPLPRQEEEHAAVLGLWDEQARPRRREASVEDDVDPGAGVSIGSASGSSRRRSSSTKGPVALRTRARRPSPPRRRRRARGAAHAAALVVQPDDLRVGGDDGAALGGDSAIATFMRASSNCPSWYTTPPRRPSSRSIGKRCRASRASTKRDGARLARPARAS
jgi:hypothetical protein